MTKLVRTISYDGGYDEPVQLTEKKWWNSDTVRAACIRNDLFTAGTNKAYENMLAIVDQTRPTLENIFETASCIEANSMNQSITNIMYILNSEAIKTTYEINGSDER